jgi:hypothetical protein
MSDVPELDKLLDDHHIFKQNIAWERSERRWMFSVRLILAGAIAAVFSVFSHWAFGLALFPFVLKSFFLAFPDPPRKDPFVRYKRM